MIPILIRTKDRPFYLNTTLSSLTATKLDNSLIVIADDCSTSQQMNDYLFTNNKITLEQFNWFDEIDSEVKSTGQIIMDELNLSNKEIWEKYIGNIPIKQNVTGLKDRFNVIQPIEQKGDKGGLLWTIFAGFSLFRNADKIVILEDDLIFHKNWLKTALNIYSKDRSNNIGCVSVYNRENKIYSNDNVNLFYENPNIGGVMYLIPRHVFNLMKNDGLFDLDISSNELAGDVFFQNWLASKNLKILNSITSYIQHIGIKSMCRPGRFLRYSKNFLQPFSWNRNF